MNDAEAARIRETIGRALSVLCPHWLASEVEDLAQAATVRVLERLDRAGDGAEPLAATYLWRAAHSALVDRIRARARRPTEPLERGERAIDPADTAPGPEAALRSGRLREAIRACLETIVAPRRRAVALHLLGHSVDEIAQLAGWAVKRADNLVYRGLGNLRACLAEKGYGHAD